MKITRGFIEGAIIGAVFFGFCCVPISIAQLIDRHPVPLATVIGIYILLIVGAGYYRSAEVVRFEREGFNRKQSGGLGCYKCGRTRKSVCQRCGNPYCADHGGLRKWSNRGMLTVCTQCRWDMNLVVFLFSVPGLTVIIVLLIRRFLGFK